MEYEDTIAAVSTPYGYGGISIIRVSGEQAFEIVNRVVRRPNGQTFAEQENGTICYAHIVDAAGEILDEVLVSKMPAPHTFTAEDVAEINCHGGITAVRRVLDELIAQGARPAEPGEFTKRAFLNGRIDLSQAEAVTDIIYAKSALSAKAALSQLSGVLSEEIGAIKQMILKLLADLEVTIQYPEYDVPDVTDMQLLEMLRAIEKRTHTLLDTYQTGDILRNGLKIVIAGKPNVGKSLLLNRLIKENKAIVTDIPGTTRDTVDAQINLGGIPICIIDTAGIHESSDPVETIGIQKSKESLSVADVVLFVADASEAPSLEDKNLLAEIRKTASHFLIVLNKTDAGVHPETETYYNKEENAMYLSALTREGLDRLEEKLIAFVHAEGEDIAAHAMISNARHKALLESALRNLRDAIGATESGLPVDLCETDIREAWFNLGKITGETVSEDIIDEIFSNFCLGK